MLCKPDQSQINAQLDILASLAPNDTEETKDLVFENLEKWPLQFNNCLAKVVWCVARTDSPSGKPA